MVSHFQGKIYPDKTFSIGYVPAKKKIEADVVYDCDYENQLDSYSYLTKSYRGDEWENVKFYDKGRVPDRFIKGTELSQREARTSRPPQKYGKNGITKLGKKSIANIALLLQQKYTKFRLGFYTATVPPLSDSDLKHLLANWHIAVKRFFERIKRYMKKQGIDFQYIGCTEIQEERFVRYGQAFPHLHWVAECRKGRGKAFYITADVLRDFWYSSILQALHGCTGNHGLTREDFNASIDAVVVKKNASAYLGKYLSKGCKVVKNMLDEGYEDFPKQWWSASMQMRKWFKKSIIHIDARTADDIFYRLGDYLEEGLITWCNYAWAEYGGKEVCFGCYGRISEDMHLAFIENST